MRIRLYIMIAVFVMSSVLTPSTARAGVPELLSRVASWWGAHSIKQPNNQAIELLSYQATKLSSNQATSGERRATNRAGMCIVPREQQKIVCEPGSGFLCVDTPPGGVAGDSFTLRGTIDRRSSVLGSIRIAVQNEYTKKTAAVSTSNPSGGDCTGSLPAGVDFCLDRNGHFSAMVPLAEKGPHTIKVSASRLSGGSEEKSVRTSRVVALSMNQDSLAFTPDVRTEENIDAATVMVAAEFLGNCSFCDFIGASTGGVKFTVENTITDSRGSEKRISCQTTVEQGGEGRFEIGVPVSAGTNSLVIRACNAAYSGGACPEVKGISFRGTGTDYSLEILSPPPQPSYDSVEYPTIPWRFKLGGLGCANLSFNRESPQKVCASESGEYSVELNPKIGINIVTLSAEDGSETFAWTFGWGRIVSPFGDSGGVINIPHAAGVVIPTNTVTNVLVPIVNNFLKSDELEEFLAKMFEAGDSEEETGGDSPPPEPVSIPKCKDSGAAKDFVIELGGKPSIGSVVIKNLVFGEDKADFRVTADDVRARINLAPDKDGDGKPDKDPLPIILKFRKAVFDISLEISKDADGKTLVLLSSPHNDCDFKRGFYCTHAPAPLIPQNLVGGRKAGEGFLECDVDAAGDEAKEACRAMNLLNAQTGIIAEKIIDAINNSIHCGGSVALTRIVRGGSRPFVVRAGCFEGEECGMAGKMIAPIEMPISVNLKNGVDISSSKIAVNAGVSVGDEKLYAETPQDVKIESAGIIVGDSFDSPRAGSMAYAGKDISLALSFDLVNALLYSAIAHGNGRGTRGLLDLDVSELSLNDLGLDFVKSCDAFEPPDDPTVGEDERKPPMWCLLRPRVGELLGTPLTTYGYYEPKQPLLVSIRGNRALGPRIAVAELSELAIVPRLLTAGGAQDTPAVQDVDTPGGSLLALEIGGLAVSFYALKVDESASLDRYRNLPIKKDANGEPITESDSPIVSFDLTLLLGIEVGAVEMNPEDDSEFLIKVRPLADRSRLVLSPMEGSNSTIVPPEGMIATLEQEMSVVLADRSSPEKAFHISIPKEFAISAGDSGGLFGLLGLKTISIDANGLTIGFDPAQNSVELAVAAAIKQVLHEEGEKVEHEF